MTSNNLFVLTAGITVTLLAVVAFLLSLRHGLKHGRWLPLIAITSLWLLAMLIYAFSEISDLDGSTRQRIGAALTLFL
ncbi:MAG: hypothetical protein HKN70_00450 [Gammaproteobacteria bacterium]|nr:hypothetical protein [Gammaproteobacteria bacterium]